jgi:hypothetical protein
MVRRKQGKAYILKIEYIQFYQQNDIGQDKIFRFNLGDACKYIITVLLDLQSSFVANKSKIEPWFCKKGLRKKQRIRSIEQKKLDVKVTLSLICQGFVVQR